uniref:Uncharacterized protein n=1 Tax=viral metagenome TaxID=1070528 RepID=A0A6C0H631_9ZZZZ
MIVYLTIPFDKLRFHSSFDIKWNNSISLVYSDIGIFEINNNQIYKIIEDDCKINNYDIFIFDNSIYQKQPVISQLPTNYSLFEIQIYKIFISQLNSTLFIHKCDNSPDSFFFETNLLPNQFTKLFNSFVDYYS